MPLKFGCLPGHVPVGLKELSCYCAGPLPAAPAAVPVPEIAWGMDGNDRYGDCGVAGINHGFMAAAMSAGVSERWPADTDVISYYLGYTHGQDSGVVLADFLGYVRQHGFFSRTLSGYAPVAVHDIPALHFAVWAYAFAYTGIRVTQPMMTAFSAGEPWTLAAAQDTNVLGGHCVPVVGYDSGNLYCVTWGKLQPVEYAAWHYMASEAWAVIPGEFSSGDGRGVSLAALETDLACLT